MVILVQKSVRCILWGGWGVVACDIFLIGGSAMCDRGERGLNLVKKCDIFFEWPLHGIFETYTRPIAATSSSAND